MNHIGGLEALISSTPWGKSFDNYNIKEYQERETIFGPNISAPFQRIAISSLLEDMPHYSLASSLLFYLYFFTFSLRGFISFFLPGFYLAYLDFHI